MKLPNKLQTLLTDLTDEALHRRYHVRCALCDWEVRNLAHRRFATRRAQNHCNNMHHQRQIRAALTNELLHQYEVWRTRA